MTADTAAPETAAPETPAPETAAPNSAAPETAAPDTPPPAPPPAPVVTVVLVRHGRSTANTAGVLAGRTPGVLLDEHGTGQAAGVADRLAGISIDRLISSPLERCRQTLEPFAKATGLDVEIDERLAEVDYGHWSGRPLKDLATEPLWRTVQQHPSAAVFPGGEGLATVSSRAAEAVRDIRQAAVKDQTVLICSHGDVIKAILADALGLHLDCFQRIVVAPASLSVIRYTPLRPFVERINDTGDLGLLRPTPAAAAADMAVLASSAVPTSDAVPGGVTH